MGWSKGRIAAAIGLTLYWPGIFVLTHIRISVPGWVRPSIVVNDKSVHYLVYLVLVLLWLMVIKPRPASKFRKHIIWITFAIFAAYAGFDEWSQGFVGRQSSLYDFIADVGGIVTALILLYIFNPDFPSKSVQKSKNLIV